jgi:PhoPQ-activated pathogenicity-related protein
LGTNDRYWPLEALNLYWPDLSGEKHILYVPNNGHGLNDFTRIIGTVSALHRQAAGGKKIAKLSWQLTDDNDHLTLSVTANEKPSKVSAWLATSESRDFRDSKWSSQPTAEVDGAYRYELPRPKSGYAAIFGEAVFDADAQPYFLSTNVKVIKAKDGDDVAR